MDATEQTTGGGLGKGGKQKSDSGASGNTSQPEWKNSPDQAGTGGEEKKPGKVGLWMALGLLLILLVLNYFRYW